MAASSYRNDTDDVLGRSRYHAVEQPDSLLHRLVGTNASLAPTIARLALGAVMFPHGAQKAFGWFGGYGAEGTYRYFTSTGMPGALAAFVIGLEITCAIALILGAFTRLAALGVIAIMAGAIYMVHLPNGFWMNWYGAQKGEGFEYHLLAIGLALVCLIAGAGRASVDRLLMHRRPAAGGGVDQGFVAP